MSDATDLKKFILERRDKLTRQQKKLAAFVLENMGEIPFLPVPVLARKADVSEATVVRFSQRLGFDGFSGLKSAFVEHLHTRKADEPPKPSGDTTMELVLDQEMANMRKCMSGNDGEVFLDAARRIAKADMLFCFGLGASSILAEYTTYLFNQIGVRACTISPRQTSPMEILVTFKPYDHLCCFSFPPYSEPTITLLKEAHARKVVTTVFSDKISAPASRWATNTLVAPSEGMMFTNSLTALMGLVNALITEVGKQCGSQTLEAVNYINKTLGDDPNILT